MDNYLKYSLKLQMQIYVLLYDMQIKNALKKCVF